eukprot:CAMPEP_0119333054 /NCGR_PEP_ID=MMETSP1333-20130426/84254_1 /TAXON_ID=418940 /ORGANISM="Scyphosphaera apsteinii, Strain RCC1455" /LENGTH=125 /DNA_ID=CAMNT_0007343003 /DNA_START=172 /DNA_END=545 /DNA_ORIENTATION=-
MAAGLKHRMLDLIATWSVLITNCYQATAWAMLVQTTRKLPQLRLVNKMWKDAVDRFKQHALSMPTPLPGTMGETQLELAYPLIVELYFAQIEDTKHRIRTVLKFNPMHIFLKYSGNNYLGGAVIV